METEKNFGREANAVKQQILFLVLVMVAHYSVAPTSNSAQFDDPPPPLTLPGFTQDTDYGTPADGEELPPPLDISGESILESIADPTSLTGNSLSAESCAPGEGPRVFGFEPALLESTGTWLRRGFWYTELDVVVSDRIWRRDDLTLIFQGVGRTTNQFGQTVFLTNDLLLEGGQFGAEATPRLKLGRFLFRDYKNRDHVAEFIIYGGGQWSQSGRLDVNPLNSEGTTGLIVNPMIDDGNDSFTGATSSDFVYNSRLNSFELNYHVKSRMKRDRMELEPSGQWVRRAQPSRSLSLIAGIRYIDLSEDLTWRAFGIPDVDGDSETETGNYLVSADNNIFGPQAGFSWTHERARWSLGAHWKGGILVSRNDVNSSFEITGGPASGDNDIEDDNITFLTEASFIGKWHLRPNVSLRAGVEGMFLTSLALAPEQLNFVPVSTSEIIANGHATFLGGLVGLETYW